MEVMLAVMAKDRRLSVRMIAAETGLDKNAVHRIPTDRLYICKINTKLAPETCLWRKKKSEPVGNLSGFAGKTRN